MFKAVKVPAINSQYRDDLSVSLGDHSESRVISILTDNGWTSTEISNALDGQGYADLRTTTGKVTFSRIDY